MTVLDVTNKLFEWFSDNDSFVIEDDFNKVILISDSRERDIAATELALKSLEESNLIQKKTIKEKEYWILSRPFGQYEQTVSVSAVIASGIAETINQFCDLIEDQTDRCDPTLITEKDIRNILIVSNYWRTSCLKDSEEK